MKGNWRLVGGAVALLTVPCGTWVLRPSTSVTQETRVANPRSLPHEQPQSIGWVFGRLVGIPGADKPLMTGSGLGSRLPPIPPDPVTQR